MKDHGSYWIVRAKGSKESAPARSFREWLMAEMAETNRKFASLKAQPCKTLTASAGPSVEISPNDGSRMARKLSTIA